MPDIYDHPLMKYINQNAYKKDLSNIEKAFQLLKEDVSTSTWNKATLLRSFMRYMERVLPNNEIELLEEYYDYCFSKKALMYNKYNLMDVLMPLDSFEEGRKLLIKFNINLEKNYPALRKLAYERVLEDIEKIRCLNINKDEIINSMIEKLIRYEPKEINHKLIIEKNLSLITAEYLMRKNIELSKTALNKLAKKLYEEFIKFDGNIELFNYPMNKYAEILSNSSIFQNSIAPTNNFQNAMYKFFDKFFPLPTYEEIKKTYGVDEYKKYVLNEFSKKLYNHPNYNYVHINSKIAQRINIKFSGKAFVHPETHEENMERETQSRLVTKRLKI